MPLVPHALQAGSQVLARLPLSTLRLDSLEGLDRLDWLLLDEFADAMAVLEHGTRALAETLLLQVRVVFQPSHARQPTLTEVSHWASRHGFAFFRLHDPAHRSLMPTRVDLPQPQATQLASADALFVPDAARLARLDDPQRQRLAFLLDTLFGIHDLPSQLLAAVDTALAERYLFLRGYTQAPSDGTTQKAPAFRTLAPSKPRPLQALASLLAEHRLLPAIRLARQHLNQHEHDHEARYLLAQALSHWGQHQEAISELATLCSQVKAGSERELRVRLALGWAQWRAGQTPLAKRTLETLSAAFGDALAVQHLSLFLYRDSQKPRELTAALRHCETLLKVEEARLRAADMGRPSDLRADWLDAKGRIERALGTSGANQEAALTQAAQAVELLGPQQGPRRTRLLLGLGLAQRAAGDTQAAIETLWQACASVPQSLDTVTAHAQLRETLAQSEDQADQALATLHQRVFSLWQRYPDKGLTPRFNDFGLPYQAFEPLRLPGSRPTLARLAAYGLEAWLPEQATALDIGCNHGYLLLV